MGGATLKLATAVLVLSFVLAACAAGEDGTGSEGDAGTTVAEEETTVNGSEETTVLAGPGGIPDPPDSTLSYGGREVKGQLGSYCWNYRNSGLCADKAGIPPPKRMTLTVPSGSEMVFRYGRHRPPNTVQIEYVSPLGKQDGSHPSLNAEGSGVERTIPVKLPPGEYVLSVFVREQQGDASYSFRIMVE
jgi:hypothetical protein